MHLKENQQLKYLNRGSTHTESYFQVIPLGVPKLLALLTTRKEDMENMKMDELYPATSCEGASNCKTCTTCISDPSEILDDTTYKFEQLLDKGKKSKKNQEKRKLHFCIGTSKLWSTPIHAKL